MKAEQRHKIEIKSGENGSDDSKYSINKPAMHCVKKGGSGAFSAEKCKKVVNNFSLCKSNLQLFSRSVLRFVGFCKRVTEAFDA
jgi:hypothetical protein